MQIEIVTPKGSVLSTEVDELTAPGALGEFGVLPGHTPLLAALRPGLVSWKRGVESGALVVSAGYLEVSDHDRIVILTNASLPPEQIDLAAARHDLDEAERAINEPTATRSDDLREQLELKRAWAQARLNARNSK